MHTFFNRFKFATKYFILLTHQHFTKWYKTHKNPVYEIRNKKTGFWEKVSFFRFYISTLESIITKIY